jgi:hypothetical protein
MSEQWPESPSDEVINANTERMLGILSKLDAEEKKCLLELIEGGDIFSQNALTKADADVALWYGERMNEQLDEYRETERESHLVKAYVNQLVFNGHRIINESPNAYEEFGWKIAQLKSEFPDKDGQPTTFRILYPLKESREEYKTLYIEIPRSPAPVDLSSEVNVLTYPANRLAEYENGLMEVGTIIKLETTNQGKAGILPALASRLIEGSKEIEGGRDSFRALREHDADKWNNHIFKLPYNLRVLDYREPLDVKPEEGDLFGALNSDQLEDLMGLVHNRLES